VPLKNIKKSVNELLPESSILPFGSRARHNNTADNDYDLMIIIKVAHGNKEIRLFKHLNH